MFLLDEIERADLWRQLTTTIENYINQVANLPVAPEIDLAAIRSHLESFDFAEPHSPLAALNFAVDNLREFQVHTPHPRYFGLFNPAPTMMGIVADALVGLFNPQLAAWSHSPFAAEVERYLVRVFAARFGYDAETADGTFCSGGAEANHTALICALTQKFPQFAENGLRALSKQPVFYVSSQSHHSLVKAARFCGLGSDSVREIEIDENFRMSADDLVKQIAIDRENNFAPFFVVATAGTTNGGTIDEIAKLAGIAAGENLWFHVDAAWGGAAAFVPELRDILCGIDQADSITFDAHKWLSVPMGAGLYLTRHNDILNQACRIKTDYMPRSAAELNIIDPYVHSMQWSRRFIGLKVFLSLAVAGWEGYEKAIRHQTAMGALLRRELEAAEWKIVNKTELPVVCFTDARRTVITSSEHLDAIANRVVSSGKAWLSMTRLAANTPVLRACVTNYRTEVADVFALVQTLNEARFGD